MTNVIVLNRADKAPLSTSFHHAAFGKDDPFSQQREMAWEGPQDLAVGRVSFVGELDVVSYPHVETLVVVEGELSLMAEGAEPLVLGPNMGAVIGRGTALRIGAALPVRFVFCAAACAQSTQPGLVRLPSYADADFKPSATLPVEVLFSQPPQCRSDNVFTESAAHFVSGIWDSTPYHRIVRGHLSNEFMHLVAGGVRFAAPDGSVQSLNQGDTLFVPRGTPIGWESSEQVAKYYVVQKIPA